MKKVLNAVAVLFLVWGCDPKKDPAPAAVLGKAFVEISTPNTNLTIGDTLTVKGKYTNENNVTSVPGFGWTSSKSDVASVTPLGKVSALAIGQTFIIAEYLTKKDTIIITVLPTTSTNTPTTSTSGTSTTVGSQTTTAGSSGNQTTTGTSTTTTPGSATTTSGANLTVSTVIILAQMATLPINGTQQMQAQVYNSSSTLLLGKSVTWISSDTSILKTTTAGFVTAVKAGSATITATSEGVNSIAYSITVSATSRMGTFSKVGSYSINGTGILKVDAGGNLKIEFSTNFSVSSGPDLFVYLSNVSSGSAVNTGGLLIASLGSTSGTRTYTVPSGTGINDYKFLVVHCRQFSSTFGNAELK